MSDAVTAIAGLLGPVMPVLGPLVAAVATGFLAPYLMERLKRIYDLQLKREEARQKSQGVTDQTRADDQKWFREQVEKLRGELVEQDKRHKAEMEKVNAVIDEWERKYWELFRSHTLLEARLARAEGDKGPPASPAV